MSTGKEQTERKVARDGKKYLICNVLVENHKGKKVVVGESHKILKTGHCTTTIGHASVRIPDYSLFS